MSTQKDLGNEAFKAKDYQKAIQFYTEAIEVNPSDHTVYGNRAMAYSNLSMYGKSLDDAEKCIEIKPDWGKGYHRKAAALHGIGDLEGAASTYEEGMKVDPSNAAMKKGYDQLKTDVASQTKPAAGGPPGAGGMGGGGDMFGGPEADAKLRADPTTSKFFQDPMFVSMWNQMKGNPQMLLQACQQDARMMACFKVLTGIDLMDVQEQQMKQKEKQEESLKKTKEQLKKKQEEEEAARKQAEFDALPQEQKDKMNIKKEAEAIKQEGNTVYKARKFEEALAIYQKAIDKNPDEPTFYNNKAACWFEMKNYEKCIEETELGLSKCKGENYDYVKTGKLMARKGNALVKIEKYDDAIEIYQKALLEHNDHPIKMALNNAKKMKAEADALAYINPDIAEEHRQKGNEFFKNNEYPKALKEYEEGLKRDPNCLAIYSNRCATYIKLLVFGDALKDADKCLQLDPKFIKAHARKGTCHHMMKEYHKALAAFDAGLKIDPDNKDCQEGKARTIMTIQSTAGADSGTDEERLRRAQADPEIQKIMSDPTIVEVLRALQSDPKGAQAKLQDPYVADCLNKLVAAGVLKMG